MTGDGPTINEHTMLDYLNDRLDDPVTQQYLDQALAASDELREAANIEVERPLLAPTDAKLALIHTMWPRLIAESEANRCEHLAQRALQPTVILPLEQRQLCGDCWHDWPWKPFPEVMTIREARKYHCDGCERRFTRRWDDHDNGEEGITTETRPFWHYIAPLLLCRRCWRTLNSDFAPWFGPPLREALEAAFDERQERRGRE